MTDSERLEVLAFIGLGANLGDARGAVLAAVQSIAALVQTRVVSTSSLYRTAPLEAIGPDYINAVLSIRTTLNAPELLGHLQQIETAAGRQRPYLNAPRTLDLDILLFGQDSISSPDLTVPHRHMLGRAFVLVPLAEIAPELVSTEQLRAVADQAIERLGSICSRVC